MRSRQLTHAPQPLMRHSPFSTHELQALPATLALMAIDDLLLRLYETQLHQLAYRRARENEVFTWSSTILVGFIAAALLFTGEQRVVLLQQWPGAILASGVMAMVTWFSVLWQLKQRYFLSETQRVIVNIERELGFFDHTRSMLPRHWETWGSRNAAFGERVRKPSKITATILLGALAASSALLSAYLR